MIQEAPDLNASSIAVLASGGLDSALLIADLAETCERVHPLFVRSGHQWESLELEYLGRFIIELGRRQVMPETVLDLPVGDLYPAHWSLTGKNVPDADSRDEEVYLPGRNLLLLSKGLIWCGLNGVPALALGTLQGNPFPDATDRFMQSMEQTVELALDRRISVLRPFAGMMKGEVIARNRAAPLEWTLSCISPVGKKHCGRCNKCAERQRAFIEAGETDPTEYAG